MKLFRSRKIVQAEQYTGNNLDKYVKIGKSANTGHWSDRFDDTPDGPYVQGEEYKHKVAIGDWVILSEDNRLFVLSDKEFKQKYENNINIG